MGFRGVKCTFRASGVTSACRPVSMPFLPLASTNCRRAAAPLEVRLASMVLSKLATRFLGPFLTLPYRLRPSSSWRIWQVMVSSRMAPVFRWCI